MVLKITVKNVRSRLKMSVHAGLTVNHVSITIGLDPREANSQKISWHRIRGRISLKVLEQAVSEKPAVNAPKSCFFEGVVPYLGHIKFLGSYKAKVFRQLLSQTKVLKLRMAYEGGETAIQMYV